MEAHLMVFGNLGLLLIVLGLLIAAVHKGDVKGGK